MHGQWPYPRLVGARAHQLSELPLHRQPRITIIYEKQHVAEGNPQGLSSSGPRRVLPPLIFCLPCILSVLSQH